MVATEQMLPLSAMQPADLRRVQVAGLLLPYRSTDHVVFVTLWDAEPFAVMAHPMDGFTYFQITERTKDIGVFFPKPTIVVDLTSIVPGASVWDETGTLMLSGGRAHVVANIAGNGFRDPQKVPLWTPFENASGDEDIAFKRWGISLGGGTDRQIIWERPQPIADLDLTFTA